jgi:hypothetical protein
MERVDSARPCISLGRILATPGALGCLARHDVNASSLLWRHQHGDWGDLGEEDRQVNEIAVAVGSRVLSNYALGAGERVWIITEADRSVTTLLLPSEY